MTIRAVTRAALERGLSITSFGWPRQYRPADFVAELEEARRQNGELEAAERPAKTRLNSR